MGNNFELFNQRIKKKNGKEKQLINYYSNPGLPAGSVIKNLPAKQEMWVPFFGNEDPPEKETHSSILAWEVPWTEEHGGL